MASRFILPKADVGNGIAPSDGAKLFFTENFTDTPKNTFPTLADALAGTNANTNPVIADSDGQFDNIFITGIYRVRLRDKNDVQVGFGVADNVSETTGVADANNDKRYGPNFATIAAITAANPVALDGIVVDLTIGMVVAVEDYATGRGSGIMFFAVVAGGTGTADGGKFIDLANGLQLRQNFRKSVISVKQYGVVGTGIPLDTVQLQAALDGATRGQEVWLAYTRCKITSITVPFSIKLTGNKSFAVSDNYTAADYAGMTNTLLLDNTSTITCENGAYLEGVTVLPDGMVFPQPGSSSWLGTAFTVDAPGATINTIDVVLRNCFIVGFAKMMTAVDAPRLILDNVNFDCNAGVTVNTAGDPVKFTKCHGWPFGTISHPTGGAGEPADPGVRDRRSGIAYEFINNADAGKLSECFAFAYNIGFRQQDVNGLTYVNCGSDDYNLFTPITSTGFVINGQCGLTVLTACQSVAHVNGVDMSAADDTNILQINGGLYSINTENFHVTKGTLVLSGPTLGAADRAVGLFGATNRLTMDNCQLQGITSEVVLNNAASPFVFIGKNNITQDIAGIPMYSGAVVEQSIPSAATTVLPGSGDEVLVTGTTGIFGFSGGWPGRTITIRFGGILTVSDSAIVNISGNFVTTADDILMLTFTSATQCYEVSRSVN